MPVVAMIERSAVAAIVTNPRLQDNPIIACNSAFEALTGYRREEVLGKNCAFLAGQRQQRLLVNEIKTSITERRPLLAEVLNYKKDGTAFRNALLIVPIFDAEGNLIYFLGSQSEIIDPTKETTFSIDSSLAAKFRRLTRRQQQVLAFMISGMRNKEIAKRLIITERTVKLHRKDLLKPRRNARGRCDPNGGPSRVPLRGRRTRLAWLINPWPVTQRGQGTAIQLHYIRALAINLDSRAAMGNPVLRDR